MWHVAQLCGQCSESRLGVVLGSTPVTTNGTDLVKAVPVWQLSGCCTPDNTPAPADPAHTTASDFPQVIQVDTMSRNFKAADLDGTQAIRYANVAGQYKAVRLPYKGSTGLAAVFVLPDKQYKSVFDAAAKITGAAVLDRANWVNLFDIGSLAVTVPRFKVSVNQLAVTKVGDDAAVSSVNKTSRCMYGMLV